MVSEGDGSPQHEATYVLFSGRGVEFSSPQLSAVPPAFCRLRWESGRSRVVSGRIFGAPSSGSHT